MIDLIINMYLFESLFLFIYKTYELIKYLKDKVIRKQV